MWCGSAYPAGDGGGIFKWAPLNARTQSFLVDCCTETKGHLLLTSLLSDFGWLEYTNLKRLKCNLQVDWCVKANPYEVVILFIIKLSFQAMQQFSKELLSVWEEAVTSVETKQ